MNCFPFHFWYDPSLYRPVPSVTTKRKRVLFYARPRTARRGFELGLLTLALVAKRVQDVEFVLAGMTAGELKVPFEATFPGVLEIQQLPALYSSVTAALVISHTNLSLLPIELMACGCPLVSNSGANVEWLLSKENCLLAEPNPQRLANELVKLLENESLRQEYSSAGLRFAQGTTLKNEVDKIESAFLMGLTQ
jgi:glycosyltransferase involved in cell wall biosynthesis